MAILSHACFLKSNPQVKTLRFFRTPTACFFLSISKVSSGLEIIVILIVKPGHRFSGEKKAIHKVAVETPRQPYGSPFFLRKIEVREFTAAEGMGESHEGKTPFWSKVGCLAAKRILMETCPWIIYYRLIAD